MGKTSYNRPVTQCRFWIRLRTNFLICRTSSFGNHPQNIQLLVQHLSQENARHKYWTSLITIYDYVRQKKGSVDCEKKKTTKHKKSDVCLDIVNLRNGNILKAANEAVARHLRDWSLNCMTERRRCKDYVVNQRENVKFYLYTTTLSLFWPSFLRLSSSCHKTFYIVRLFLAK